MTSYHGDFVWKQSSPEILPAIKSAGVTKIWSPDLIKGKNVASRWSHHRLHVSFGGVLLASGGMMKGCPGGGYDEWVPW